MKVQNKTPTKGPSEARKLRILIGFLLGVEGGLEGGGMPADVFPVMMGFLMPEWDQLRRENLATGEQGEEDEEGGWSS